MKTRAMAAGVALAMTVSGCAEHQNAAQRTLVGSALGAGVGAAAGAALGGGAFTGGVTGAVVGGALGALVKPPKIQTHRYYRDAKGTCYYIDDKGAAVYSPDATC